MNTAISCGRFFVLALMLTASLWVPAPSHAAFGLTSDSNFYTVDTGAGLVFQVRRTDNGSNTQSAGDIASLVYNGVQYQDQTRGSQVNSGFDYLYNGISAVSVNAAVINTNYIEVTVQAGSLTHYYLARHGYPNIYMGTYFTNEPDIDNLCRYIVRIPSGMLPNGPVPSDILNTVSTVEADDVFALSDGETRSKHYSNQRLTDWAYIGATGNNVGVWMVRDNNEGNSGGPFYRCLLNQCGTDQEITYIVNYGESQTEAFRTGILNTYTLVFTTGAAPSLPIDTSWFSGMGMTGYVPTTGRGSVTGAGISGRDTNYTYTVGFANSTAQYWTAARASDGYFNCANMLPGTYTMTVYKNELAVYTSSVAVTASSATSLNPLTITGDPSSAISLWRIGDWDGSPGEFLNGDKITSMHPSDVRISTWNPGVYTVGVSSPATGFPCYQWKNVNGTQTVQFTLPPALVASYTIRVGITCAYSNARPAITVNSWTSSNPSPSNQPTTRTLTIGTYRGNNTTFTFNVPASAFVAGTNTMTIYPISGSTGTTFLSPGYSVDCVDMTTPSPAIANDTYALVPRNAPGSALDVQNSGTANGNPIDIHAYTGANNQRFLLDLQSDGSYRIRTALTGNRCLDLTNWNTSNGNKLQIYDDNGLEPQHWYVIPVGSGWYRIAPKLNIDKAVDVTNAGTADGTLVQNWDYLGNTCQQWKLVPSSELYTTTVSNGTYVVSPQNAPGSALDAQNANNSSPIDIHSYTGASSQQFLFDLQTDGTYRIRTALTGNRCLDLPYGNTANGIDLQLYDDNGLDPQRWYVIPVGNGWYKIAPKLNIDKSLDVFNFGTADGTSVDDWDYLGGANQLWSLTIPSPTVTALSPAQAVAGSQPFTLTVTGANFTASSAILWNGAALPTTFVSATQLTATVPASAIAAPGTIIVTVAGASAPATFKVALPSLKYVQASVTRSGSSLTASVTLSNTASIDAPAVSITAVSLILGGKTLSAGSLPQSAGMIPAGGTGTVTLQFPNWGATSGTAVLRLSGTYAATGTFSTTGTCSIPR